MQSYTTENDIENVLSIQSIVNIKSKLKGKGM
jgi:hypothetical protein